MAPAHPQPERWRLEVAQRVSIAFDDEIIAGIVRELNGAAQIELARRPPLPLPSRGLIQYMSSQGIMRHHGALSITGGGRLAFLPRGAPQLLLARQRLRADIRVPVEVRRADGSTIETRSIDLSESGALLGIGPPLAVGEDVKLTIHLDRHQPTITTDSVIVRFSPEGYAAAHHIQIGREPLDQLCWWIFDALLSVRDRQR
jgi:PilZ domain